MNDEQKPMLRFLTVMTAASMVGLQGYTILFNNYAVEVVGLDGQGVGIISRCAKCRDSLRCWRSS